MLVTQYPIPTFTAINYGSPSIPALFTNAASSHTPTKSNPSCYHHLFETCAPSYYTASSQRSRIGWGEIYYAAVFCLLMTYASTSSNPASRITYSK